MTFKVKTTYNNATTIYEAIGELFTPLREQVILKFTAQGLVNKIPEVLPMPSGVRQYVILREAVSEDAAKQYAAALIDFFATHPEAINYLGSEVVDV